MDRPTNAPLSPPPTEGPERAVSHAPQLSQRELEVLDLVAQGRSNREIARELILAVGTVKTHIHNISSKLNASNRTQAVAYARMLGLLAENNSIRTDARGGSAPKLVNPYKGLMAFQENDVDDFFGREALINDLLERMKQSPTPSTDRHADGAVLPTEQARFLAIIGPSGSGKSSVARAGLIPAVRKNTLANGDPKSLHASYRWIVEEMTPGSHPLEELEAALLRVAVNPPPSLLRQLRDDQRGLTRALKRVLPSDDSMQFLLLIDQFEEVFTQVQDEADRAHFLHNIYNVVHDPRSRIYVVVTLRADFFDRPLRYGDMGALFQERSEVVLPMTPNDLERAIIGPLERISVQQEPGLVSTIVSDVGEQVGALPMLQYALTELFEQRDGMTLTLDAYCKNGGVAGALARRADSLYAELDENGREITRQLFLRLVVPGEGMEETRRRVSWEEIAGAAQDEDAVRTVARRFGKFRLITFDHDPVTGGPSIEVAHEALIQEWSLLRDWIEESRDDMRLQRQLAAAAQEWFTAGSDDSYLLRGARLAQFEDWSSHTTLNLTSEPRNFLAASVARRARENADSRDKLTREADLERHNRQRLRNTASVLAIAAILAVVLAVFAFNQNRVANTALDAEQQARSTADANLLAAEAARATSDASEVIARREADLNRSMALIANAQLARSANNNALAIALALEAAQSPNPPASAQLVLSEAAYAPGARYELLKPTADRLVMQMAVNPEGTQVLLGFQDGGIVLQDLTTGAELASLEGHRSVVTSVAFNHLGDQALSSSQDGTLILWDLATGRIVRRFNGHSGVVTDAAFSADSTQAISGSFDGTLILWDLNTGKILQRMTGHRDIVYSVAISPDGTRAVSGSGDFSARLWDLTTGTELFRFPGEAIITNVAFGPDNRRVYTVYSGCLRVWDVISGLPLSGVQCNELEAPAKWGLAISPDGRTAITGSVLGMLQLWDTATGEEMVRLFGHTESINSVAFTPNGRQAISGSSDGSVRLWDLTNGASIVTIHNPIANSAYSDVAFTPDGDSIVLGTRDTLFDAADSSLTIFDTEEALQTGQFGGHSQPVNAIAISSDGRYVFSGSEDTTAIVWHLTTGDLVFRFAAHEGPVRAVAFHPDGRSAFSASGSSAALNFTENLIIHWNMETGQEIRRWVGADREVRSMAASPDGTTLAVGGVNSLVLWDVETGEELMHFPVTSMAGGPNTINSVVFSADGSSLLTGSSDTFLALWDVASGSLIRRFSGHADVVRDVAFSPDERTALSGSDDGSLILWDVASGQALRRYHGHRGAVTGVSYAPDGQTAASVGEDNTLRLWALGGSLEALIDWTFANRQVRDLLPEEHIFYGTGRLAP